MSTIDHTETTFSDLRVGIVGHGRAAARSLEAMRQLGVYVVGVAGQNRTRTADAARKLGVPALEPDALLERADVVHVATPTAYHKEYVLAALGAGDAVVCEAPLGIGPSECRDMRDAAEASGLFHAMHFELRYWERMRELQALLADREFGRVGLIHGRALQDAFVDSHDVDWRMDDVHGAATRVVLDLGAPLFDLISVVTDCRVVEVDARLGAWVPRMRTGQHANDWARVDLTLEDGTPVTALLSEASHGRNVMELSFDCRHATVEWDHNMPNALRLLARDASPETLPSPPDAVVDPVVGLYEEVYRAVLDGARPLTPSYPTFAAGLRQALLVDAIRESHRLGRAVSFQEPI